MTSRKLDLPPDRTTFERLGRIVAPTSQQTTFALGGHALDGT